MTESTYRTNKYYTLSGTNYIISRNPFDETATYFEKVRVAEIGLEFDAQKATFSSATYPNFATQYCENSYIEVETEISRNEDFEEVSKILKEMINQQLDIEELITT